MFRVVVQDSRFAPTSGRTVAELGSYDPHSKTVNLDKEKAVTYLKNGAQPSDRAIRLLQSEGVELPKWVKMPTQKANKLRNPEKLRKNQPKEEPATEETPVEESAEAKPEEATEAEAPAEEAKA